MWYFFKTERASDFYFPFLLDFLSLWFAVLIFHFYWTYVCICVSLRTVYMYIHVLIWLRFQFDVDIFMPDQFSETPNKFSALLVCYRSGMVCWMALHRSRTVRTTHSDLAT